MKEQKSYSYDAIIEFEDVDSYGIAHHSKLINLLERTRVHFFHDQGISVSDGTFKLVLANMDISFKHPVKMMDKVTVFLKLKKLSNFSLTWDYTIFKDETLILQALVKQASIGQNLKPCVFPDSIKSSLLKLNQD